MEPHRKGDSTEAIVLAGLKRRGIPTSLPFGDNERYDAIAEGADGELYRLQIKTGRLSHGSVNFDAVSSHTNSQGHVYERYGDEIDFFAVYCYELDRIYLIPQRIVDTSKRLRVDPPEEPDPRITPAPEYRFDQVWPPVGTKTNRESGSVADTPTDGAITEVRSAFGELGATVYSRAREGSRPDLAVETPTGKPVRVTVRTATVSGGGYD